jgi:hypothetical protein
VATIIKKVIGSTQLDQNGNLAWITAGHWYIESVVSLVGGKSGPRKELSLKLTTSSPLFTGYQMWMEEILSST